MEFAPAGSPPPVPPEAVNTVPEATEPSAASSTAPPAAGAPLKRAREPAAADEMWPVTHFQEAPGSTAKEKHPQGIPQA